VAFVFNPLRPQGYDRDVHGITFQSIHHPRHSLRSSGSRRDRPDKSDTGRCSVGEIGEFTVVMLNFPTGDDVVRMIRCGSSCKASSRTCLLRVRKPFYSGIPIALITENGYGGVLQDRGTQYSTNLKVLTFLDGLYDSVGNEQSVICGRGPARALEMTGIAIPDK
jgi:hypothetical protein